MKNNEPMKTEKKEIIAFKCTECGEVLDKGFCGSHREETEHKEFKPLYKEAQPKE